MNGSGKFMSRRQFLKISGGVSAAVLLGQSLTACTASNNYADLAADIRQNLELQNSDLNEAAISLVKHATLAANSHNSQPWKFSLEDNLLSIKPDFLRGLPVVDPEQRELWISLGCALENLLISAQTFGFQSEVDLPKNSDESIQIVLKKEPGQVKHPLFSAITTRQSNRSLYNGEKISSEKMSELVSVIGEPGIQTQIFTEADPIRTLMDLTEAGDMGQYADQNFLNELISWIRFNKKEASNSRDGLYSICAGSPNVPRWLGKTFLSGSKASSNAEENRKKIAGSAGLILISAEEDSIPAWIRSGRLYQRLALQMTQSGIQSALMNQALEIPHLRTRLAETLPAKSPYPQLLLRFGYAESMPFSLRRDVSEVMS